MNWGKRNKIEKLDPMETLRAIEMETQSVASIKDLVDHPGWIAIQKVLIEKIKGAEKSIMSMASDPVKNADKLRMKTAERRAFLGLINWADACSKTAPARFQELEARYEQILTKMDSIGTIPGMKGTNHG